MAVGEQHLRQEPPPAAAGYKVQAAALLAAGVEHQVERDVAGWRRARPIRVVLVERHDAGMPRRLGEHLVVPEPQPVDAEELRAGHGDRRMEDQVVQHGMHAPAAEEVADDLAGALGVGLLDLVEQLPVAV